MGSDFEHGVEQFIAVLHVATATRYCCDSALLCAYVDAVQHSTKKKKKKNPPQVTKLLLLQGIHVGIQGHQNSTIRCGSPRLSQITSCETQAVFVCLFLMSTQINL